MLSKLPKVEVTPPPQAPQRPEEDRRGEPKQDPEGQLEPYWNALIDAATD
jgi:hypothetical protein